ncbi:hypothetical protein ElyMa_002109900 [Elysia marginata]|uniref:Uncharacterized protein n=1 Tax=Elysia marginata TaxID=1093978 RepID=A0AAV4FFK5_9GAST|nr:hypothetical protein ElyMa_002109900 [Elysia marginata]
MLVDTINVSRGRENVTRARQTDRQTDIKKQRATINKPYNGQTPDQTLIPGNCRLLPGPKNRLAFDLVSSVTGSVALARVAVLRASQTCRCHWKLCPPLQGFLTLLLSR